MLEDELTHILSKDNELNQLILLDSAEIQGLARKLGTQNRPFVIAEAAQIPNLVRRYRTAPLSSPVPPKETRLVDALRLLLSQTVRTRKDAVVAHVLSVELHADPELLKKELSRNVERMAGFSDGILVLCGVCDSLKDLERDREGDAFPLYLLTDTDGSRAEDCIALALGGNDQRWQTPIVHRGVVFYLTPKLASWAMKPERQALLDSYVKKNAHMDQVLAQSIEKLLKRTRFKKVAKIDVDLRYEPNFDENVDDYAQLRDMHVIQLTGSTDIVERCYKRAKSGLRI